MAEEPEIDRTDELEPRSVDSLEDADDPTQPNETSTKAELVAAFESHSGPLPNRQWFEAIETLYPGTTEIIVKDYADERELRQSRPPRGQVILAFFGRRRQADNGDGDTESIDSPI